MSKVSVYQVFTRLFGNKNSHIAKYGSRAQNGSGKFNDFTDKALLAIKDLGITHVWYTGIIAHARCEGNIEYDLPEGNPQIIKGRAGSPYAIIDYYDVNPDLAENIPDRMNEFENLVVKTHKAGLKAVIDFVPNHVAREYNSTVYPDRNFGLHDDTTQAFSPNNDFYYLPNENLKLPTNSGTILPDDSILDYNESPAKVTGNDKFSSNVSIDDWYETIKLNYGVDYLNGARKKFEPTPPIWDKMVNILLFWAGKLVDGFRCDMVEMVPVEFWKYAIEKVKQKYPDIIFIGEVYNPELYDNYINIGQFDFLYDKVGLYDTLKNIIQGKDSTKAITKCWQSLNGKDDYMLSFLENHDEQRIASRFFASDPFKAIPAIIISASINKGAIMTYFGQEVGEPAIGEPGYSGDDGRTTIFDYFSVPEHQKWMNEGLFDGGGLTIEQQLLQSQYKEILNLSIKCKAISDGNFYDLMWANNFINTKSPDKLYAFLRYTPDESLLFIVNFDSQNRQQLVLNIPDQAFAEIGYKTGDTLFFEGILFEERTFRTSVAEIIKRGLWFNVLPNSGKSFKITKL